MAERSPVLTPSRLREALADLPEWEPDAGTIRATYTMPSFLLGIDLVRSAAAGAERANHHPDIDVRWRSVTFALTSHDSGGVTDKDLALARRIHADALSLGWIAT